MRLTGVDVKRLKEEILLGLAEEREMTFPMESYACKHDLSWVETHLVIVRLTDGLELEAFDPKIAQNEGIAEIKFRLGRGWNARPQSFS